MPGASHDVDDAHRASHIGATKSVTVGVFGKVLSS
jgi:hypothetical protein